MYDLIALGLQLAMTESSTGGDYTPYVEPEKKSQYKTWLLVIAIVLIIIMGLGAWYLFKKK